MNKEKDDFFLHSNEVNHINREDYVTIALYRYAWYRYCAIVTIIPR